MTQEITKATQNKLAEVLQDDLVVLLCAPVHDTLTEYTSTLLEELASLRPTNLKKFSEPLTYEDLLKEFLIESDTDVAVVFWGHGNATSLLGPPADSKSTDKSCFYDGRFIDSGPKYMLAMCCSAARGLTRLFDVRADRAFIGFDSEIGFVLAGGRYAECWKKVVQGCEDAMLTCKNVEDLRTTVQEIYKKALSEFKLNSGRYGLMMNTYLRRHLDSIDFVRT